MIGRVRTVLLLLIAAAGGCQPAASQRTSRATATAPGSSGLRDWVLYPPVVDRETSAKNLRIVSAAPNVTEMCCALGLRQQLVGRTKYCQYPPGIEQIPSIGALVDTNVEVLLGLKPDLILVAGESRAITERLTRLALPFETLPDTTLADVFTAIERIGALTGRSETARQLVAGIQADLDAVAKQFAGVAPARVLLLIGTLADPPTSPFVAGAGSFYDDLLRRAGHVNVAAASGPSFAPLSLEFIVRADPDVIIELDPDGSARPRGDADARRVWSKVGPLRAIAAGRVHVLTGPQHYLAGPRVAETFEALCQASASRRDE